MLSVVRPDLFTVLDFISLNHCELGIIIFFTDNRVFSTTTLNRTVNRTWRKSPRSSAKSLVGQSFEFSFCLNFIMISISDLSAF